MTLSGPLIGSIIFAWGAMILIALWHCATQLKASGQFLRISQKSTWGRTVNPPSSARSPAPGCAT